ncbi:Arc2 [Carabus blaptoides fortunei]
MDSDSEKEFDENDTPEDEPDILAFTGPQPGINHAPAPNINADSSPLDIFILFYKEVLDIVLEDTAIGWLGVKITIETWDEALDALRKAFGKKKPAYQLYIDLFSLIHEDQSNTDVFVCRARAILADIPDKLDEKVQLDLVYVLLNRRIRKRIPCDDITTFSDLLDMAKAVEQTLAEGSKRKEEKPPKEDKVSSKKPRMMRKNKTNRTVGIFSEELMREAVKFVVIDGMKIREAARRNNLSFQTLSRYVKKFKTNPLCKMAPNYKVYEILSSELEEALLRYITTCSKMFYCLTIHDYCKLAYDLTVANNITPPKSWEKEKKA